MAFAPPSHRAQGTHVPTVESAVCQHGISETRLSVTRSVPSTPVRVPWEPAHASSRAAHGLIRSLAHGGGTRASMD